MSVSIASQLRAQGRLDEAFMTILFCFSLSTVLTGVAFWALGKLKLGKSKSSWIKPVHSISIGPNPTLYHIPTQSRPSARSTCSWA